MCRVVIQLGKVGNQYIVFTSTCTFTTIEEALLSQNNFFVHVITKGIRVYRGKIFKLERHLKRLFKSAKALGFENIHSKEEVIEAIFRTLAVNGMRDGAHMRLTLTRGEKCTSSMNPKFNVYGTTLIILAEWKPTEGATTYDNTKGIYFPHYK